MLKNCVKLHNKQLHQLGLGHFQGNPQRGGLDPPARGDDLVVARDGAPRPHRVARLLVGGKLRLGGLQLGGGGGQGLDGGRGRRSFALVEANGKQEVVSRHLVDKLFIYNRFVCKTSLFC